MDEELQHMFHEHPLILKAEFRISEDESDESDDTDHPDLEISCKGCFEPIEGPFYSCGQCPYFLHKICAELPNELEHPMHPQHPLYLHSKPPAYDDKFCCCELCYEVCKGFTYHCSICKIDVDTICAATSRTITNKCHMHPLIPIFMPSDFFCHICIKTEVGISYKCTVCPFWVHQNCIVLLPDTVKHSEHLHPLTLLPSMPSEYRNYIGRCNICYDKLFRSQCSYYCEECKFFVHVNCGRSETSSPLSRDQDIPHAGQSPVLLPMKQNSTDFISRFVRKYIDGDANIDDKIDYFDHEHPLSLIDEKTTGNKTCDACAIAISAPSYGCVECDYFLHKCCTDLPKQIQDHPLHPQHQLTLQSAQTFFKCRCCFQYGNLFSYACFECEDFKIDIKCASILQGGVIYYEAHKHPFLIQRTKSYSFCTACDDSIVKPGHMLKCNTCNFVLCFGCAMAPPVINHRYGKSEPFKLTYSPPKNFYDEFICEICMGWLIPNMWYYHCAFADQFAHTSCMVNYGADSNIKYGKSHMLKKVHEQHEVTTISSTYDCSPCSLCRHPMRIGLKGIGAGLECKTCNFRIHLWCPSEDSYN